MGAGQAAPDLPEVHVDAIAVDLADLAAVRIGPLRHADQILCGRNANAIHFADEVRCHTPNPRRAGVAC